MSNPKYRPSVKYSPLAIGFLLFIYIVISYQSNWVSSVRKSVLHASCKSELESASLGNFQVKKFSLDMADSTLMAESRMMPNMGFLNVQGEDGETRPYGVSMYHQLHCMDLIRGQLENLGQHKRRDGEHSHVDNSAMDEHIIHCMDYITQGIVCAADGAMEEPEKWVTETGTKQWIIDGVDVYHVCKDASLLRQAVEDSVENPVIADIDMYLLTIILEACNPMKNVGKTLLNQM